MKLNQREELFAIGLCNPDIPQYKAYMDAGYSAPNTKIAMEKASRKAKQDKIQARVRQLREPVASETVVNLQERTKIYSEMAKLPIEYDKLGSDGKLKAKLESLHRLNQIEHVYSDAPTQDNRRYTLIVSPGAEDIAKRIMQGERTADVNRRTEEEVSKRLYEGQEV